MRASLRSSPALRLNFPVMAGPKNLARYLRDASTLRVDVLDPKGPRVVGSAQVPLGELSAAKMRLSGAHPLTQPPCRATDASARHCLSHPPWRLKLLWTPTNPSMASLPSVRARKSTWAR